MGAHHHRGRDLSRVRGASPVGHPAGLLTYTHAEGCSLGRAQDATQHADAERTSLQPEITRPATEAEVALLASLAVPVPAAVTVARLTRSSAVVRRHYD